MRKTGTFRFTALVLLLLAVLLFAAAAAETVGYTVLLPEGYDPAGRAYPTLYLMPYDGAGADYYTEAGTAEALLAGMTDGKGIECIVVLPAYADGQDYDACMADLIADVESRYAAIPDAAFRGILGAGVGGYMAMEHVLVNGSELFGCIGAVMGDFTSEANPYLHKGSVAEAAAALEEQPDKGYGYLSGHYFYLEAPGTLQATVIPGGTSDIAQNLEKRANPYYQYGASVYASPNTALVAFRVTDGAGDAQDVNSGLRETLSRFSKHFSSLLYSLTYQVAPRAITPAAEAVNVTATLTISEHAAKFGTALPAAAVTAVLTPANGEALSDTQETVPEAGAHVLTFSFPPSAQDASAAVSLTLLGMQHETAPTSLVYVADGEGALDLRGDWYFKAYRGLEGSDPLDAAAAVTPEIYETWNKVQPGFDWWTADFDPSLEGRYNFAGYAWYVRTFTVPEGFPTEGLRLALGSFDEGNEAYVNGTLVGSAGMVYDENGIGTYDGSNPWDVDCVYEPAAGVIRTGENTIAIRMCNASGSGGWYKGPIGLYTEAAYAALGGGSEMITASYESKATGAAETCRIYLPKGYDAAQRYPVLYLLHGINSTSKTYDIDRIDLLLDAAIEAGEIEPLIVVMADDPTKTSFWKAPYDAMVAEDLVAFIDSTYPTLADRAHRYVGGCSMGGGGAFHIGLNYSDVFSGVISFYGALRYVDAIPQAEALSDEKLASLAIWMACGNADLYDFYQDQEEMSRLLFARGIPHAHTVGDGEHANTFYMPRLISAIAYMQANAR